LIKSQTGLFWKKLRPRSKRANWPQHLPEALGRRLVETVEGLDLFDALRVHPLPAPVGRGIAASLHAPRFRQVLLHRPAGHELRHHEGDEQHPEQRGKHQQNALGDVGEHGQATS
jgi:hypothetical protein